MVKPMQGLNCNINMLWEWHMKKNTNFPRGQIEYIRGEQLLENLCVFKIALWKKNTGLFVPKISVKISVRYSKSMLFQMYVYVVWTCIRCGTNVYLGGTKMGGTKRRWYEQPGYPERSQSCLLLILEIQFFCKRRELTSKRMKA